jgi:hypothetical protein
MKKKRQNTEQKDRSSQCVVQLRTTNLERRSQTFVFSVASVAKKSYLLFFRPFRVIRVIRGRILIRIGQKRPGFGMARKKRAVFGRKWQNGTVWDSLGQATNPQHPAGQRVTKNKGEKHIENAENRRGRQNEE